MILWERKIILFEGEDEAEVLPIEEEEIVIKITNQGIILIVGTMSVLLLDILQTREVLPI
jgi:hypothetical protein